MSAIFTLMQDLPRVGPGGPDSLRRALAGVAPDARILDAGCGPGADGADLLAVCPRGAVLAMDLHAPFVGAAAARHAGDPRYCAVVGDAFEVAGPFDLIWSAGAVYFRGVTPALEGWRAALAPGGRVAFSHLCWLGTGRPDDAVAFWSTAYPEMGDIDDLRAQIAAAGFAVQDMFALPDAEWEAYYTPLEARLNLLAPAADPELAAEIALNRQEIDLWRRYRDVWGYVMAVVVPR